MDKQLSLIVPVYNMEKYLRQCLDSVILPDWQGQYEVLVINDGSKDSSLQIAREYESKYPEIFVVVDKENGGYGSCFNTGIKLARGKYVKMLDADDYFDINVFVEYLSVLSKLDVDAVLNGVLLHDDVVGKVTARRTRFVSDACLLPELDRAMVRDFFIHNFAFRRKLVISCHCLEKTLYTDGMIASFGMKDATKLYWTNLSLYCYRINRDGQSVNINSMAKHYKDYVAVANELFKMDFQSKTTYQFELDFTERNVWCGCKGISSCGISLARYRELKRFLLGFKQFLKKNNKTTKDVNGMFLRWICRLPFIVYLAWHFQIKLAPNAAREVFKADLP